METQMQKFRMGYVGLVLALVSFPLVVLALKGYDKAKIRIRDDKYLVAKQLQNHPHAD
jgi:hypothetical protein